MTRALRKREGETRHAGLADRDRGACLPRGARGAHAGAGRPGHDHAAPARAGRQPPGARPADGARAGARRRAGQVVDGGGLRSGGARRALVQGHQGPARDPEGRRAARRHRRGARERDHPPPRRVRGRGAVAGDRQGPQGADGAVPRGDQRGRRHRAGRGVHRRGRRRLRPQHPAAVARRDARGRDHRAARRHDRAPPVRVPAPHPGRADPRLPAQRVAADDRADRGQPAHDAGRGGALAARRRGAGRRGPPRRADGRDPPRGRRARRDRDAGQLSNVIAQEYAAAGGVKSLADILNHADRHDRAQRARRAGQGHGELAEEVRLLLFTFEDVVKLDDRSIQMVLKEVDQKDLAIALRGVSEDVRSASSPTCPSVAPSSSRRRSTSSRRSAGASSRRRRAASSASSAASRRPARSSSPAVRAAKTS